MRFRNELMYSFTLEETFYLFHIENHIMFNFYAETECDLCLWYS